MLPPWSAIDAVATALGVILAPGAALVWRRVRRRAVDRNVAGRCANCGLAWSEIGVTPHEYHVHGAQVCAPCAHRLRRRTLVEFAGLSVATAFASAVAYSGIVKYQPWTPWWGVAWFVSPPIALALATSLVVRRMKLRNRERTGGDRGSESLLGNGAETVRDGLERLRSGESQGPDRYLVARAT
jgi:hypothetical protein